MPEEVGNVANYRGDIVPKVELGIAAYAYLSYNITSGSSIIKAAHFDIKVSIQTTDENGETVDIKPITSHYQIHKVELNAGKLSIITITPIQNSTAKTGFAIVTTTDCVEPYYT